MIKSNHRIDFLMLNICELDYAANEINHWWEVNGYVIGLLYINSLKAFFGVSLSCNLSYRWRYHCEFNVIGLSCGLSMMLTVAVEQDWIFFCE